MLGQGNTPFHTMPKGPPTHSSSHSLAADRAWAQGSLGPFYKSGAPDKGHGLPGSMVVLGYPGDLLKLEIEIVDTLGHYVYGSTVEIWHSDEKGVYDMTGYKYRAIWHTGGTHAGIDVVTALPGVVTFDGRKIYRHVHLLITPPDPGPASRHIEDLRTELKLVLPPWTDTPADIGPVEDQRQIRYLGGPYHQGFGSNQWYLAKARIVLKNVLDGTQD